MLPGKSAHAQWCTLLCVAPWRILGTWWGIGPPLDLHWLVLYPDGTQMNHPLETLGVLGPLGPGVLLSPPESLMTPLRGALSDPTVECRLIETDGPRVDWSRGAGRLRAASLAMLQ